jgi:DNA-binding NarL/FixJ family response regulator
VAPTAHSAAPVLVVDDDPAFSEYVCLVLEGAGYETLEAATGEDALRIASDCSSLVVLLDIVLPKLNGYEVCHGLRQMLGDAAAIVFVSGARTDPVDVASGLLVGADDYMVKPVDPDELVARVGALSRRVQGTRSDGDGGDALPKLTPREAEILALLADGRSQRDMAQLLSISPKTVGLHIEHILGKLDVHSRAEAVAVAYQRKLLQTSH